MTDNDSAGDDARPNLPTDLPPYGAVQPEAATPPPPQRPKTGVSVLVAVASAGIVGVGSWFGLGALDGTDAPGATPMPSTSGPTAWAPDTFVPGLDRTPGEWTVDWAGIYDPGLAPYSPDYLNAPASFDDGLDHADLPPLVDRPSPRYPEAHELTEAIWGHVGPGWYIATYDHGVGGVFSTGIQSSPVLHLVSPEGVHFKLPDLPDDIAFTGARVTYVNVEERWAVVNTTTVDSGAGWAWFRWDLVTGEAYEVTWGSDGPVHEGVGFDAYGPLAGGGEIRVVDMTIYDEGSLTGDDWDDSTETREVSYWSPSGGEVPLEVPDGSGLDGGKNYLSVIVDEAGAFAILAVSGEPSSSWRFDVASGELSEIDNGWLLGSVLAVTEDWSIQWTWDSTTNGRAYLRVPWDGGPPEAISIDEAYAAAWATAGVASNGWSADGWSALQIVDSSGGTGQVIYPNESGVGDPLWEAWPTAIGGDRVMVSGVRIEPETGWGARIIIGYDRSTGALISFESERIPDTGWITALASIYVIPATPGEEG